MNSLGGALTAGTSADAYALQATNGTLNVNLADPQGLKDGTTSDAVLTIQATNDAVFDSSVSATATAAAIYSVGGDNESVIAVNANNGTINIQAEAAETEKGSRAFGAWAAGGENSGTVNLAGGNAITISVIGGSENQIFTPTQQATDNQWALQTDTLAINNAAIYADGSGSAAKAGQVNVSVKNLSVTGDVVALSNTSATSDLATITFDNTTTATNGTTSTITGNLYAINGGAIVVGAGNTDEGADAVTVSGETFIVGKASTTASTLTVNANATYTAQDTTVVADGGSLVVNGGKYIAQDVTVSAAAASSTASISVGQTSGAANSAMTANGVTTLTHGGALNIGATGSIAGTYNALGDMVIGDAPTGAASEINITADDITGKVTLQQDGVLNIGNASHNVTATVNLGGTITGTAGTNPQLVVAKGSTLALVTTPVDATVEVKSIENILSSIDGTVQILGSSFSPATTDQPVASTNYYQGGLGVMTINDGGSVTGDEGGLYLGLINGDTLAFNGGSMIANSVQVGIGSGTANLNIGEDGDVTMLGDLIVGDASGGATGKVTVDKGTLTLADPTPATEPDGDPTSSLTINGSSSLTLSNEGTLVTNSQNLWKQAANEVIDGDNPLENNIGDKTITVDGGFIELTDAGVEASWLTNAQAAATNDNVTDTNVTFIITGQLLQAGKNVTSILPSLPAGGKKGTLNYAELAPNGGILASTALNATTQSFTEGKTTTTFQNLVVGGSTQGTLWKQGGTDGKNSLWTIDSDGSGDVVGFSSVQLSENGNILVTGGDTLVLTGTGPTNEIVSGTGELNIYVGYQNEEGTLILGGDENIAKGGTFNGNITVNKGGLEVQYGEYTVNGTVTLGVAKSGSSATATATTATPGSLEVANGTLKVQSIAGNNVESIAVIGGTLNAGELNAVMIHDDGQTEFEVVKEGNLIVGQDLTIKAANPTTTGPVGLSISESDVQVGGALLATDTNIALTAGSLTVTGDLTQGASRTTQASGLSFVLDNQGEVASTVKVGGNLSTTATTVSIEQSVVEVTGDLSITGQLNGTNTTPTTNLTLDEAQITAANINLSNVNSQDVGNTLYQSADITTGTTGRLNENTRPKTKQSSKCL